MPILPDDDAMSFVCGGPQIDKSIYRTLIGGAIHVPKEPDCDGAKNTEQLLQPENEKVSRWMITPISMGVLEKK